MPGPLVAFLDFNLAQFLVNCLAVGGGFLVGYVLAGGAAWWVDRSFLRKKTPPLVRRLVRILGGIAAAIIVALLVFGRGGGGLGGGQGEGVGSGTTSGTGPGQGSVTDAPPPTTRPAPPVAAKDVPPPDARIRVTVLGGPDVKDQRFYLVDDDPSPRTFAEAKAAVLARKDAAPQKLGVEIRFTTRNTLPRDHPAVTLLADWARDAGLAVVFPAESP